jgi:PhzF family phenazine biosynthesis protein
MAGSIMNLKIYQVDAFSENVFKGNPAAVCPLTDKWLDDAVMQNIAAENNLAETAFYIKKDGKYHIRWFTPITEVDLCGHATLASAFVLFNQENYPAENIHFHSRSGILSVRKDGGYLTMDFPTDTITKTEVTDELIAGFDIIPDEAYKGKTDYMLIFKNENQIRNIGYDLTKISRIRARGIIITAKGDDVDFVARFFAPRSGINEDPVTGSAYTTLVPYWTRILIKKELRAIQLSRRTGFVKCKYLGERTEISGKAVLYMTGEISV